MLLTTILIAIIVFLVYCILFSNLLRCIVQPIPATNQHVEKLKNALLTYALKEVYTSKFEDLNLNYSTYDGSTLPHMSGYSFENACFSYIVNKNEFRKHPFYTKTMEDKLIAIEKFLDKHIDSDAAAMDLFTDFVKKIDSEEQKALKTD